MTRFLISRFIKDYKNTADPVVRKRYGVLDSVVGIACNLILFLVKFVLGSISGSIAVTADAFNNLSDVGSSAVTLLGFKMAAKPADREHPYGHGRIEYVSGLIIAFLILLVGLDFVKSSIDKIISPEPVVFQWVVLIGLVASILVKLWLGFFHKRVGKLISSTVMGASAADSMMDVLATSVTLASVVASGFTQAPVDGYMGVVVAVLILYAGINVARDTLSPLLGKAPDPELKERIIRMAEGYEGILGVHDLIIHDYGPGRIFASMHAEVPVKDDMQKSHALIDRVENEISSQLGIALVIHMDPRDTDCELTNTLRGMVEEVVQECDPAFSIHDFRVVDCKDNITLVFDLCIPIEYKKTDQQVREAVNAAIVARNPACSPRIVIDRS